MWSPNPSLFWMEEVMCFFCRPGSVRADADSKTKCGQRTWNFVDMEKHANIFSWEFPGWWSTPFYAFFFAIVLFFIFAVSFRSLRSLYISGALKQKAIWLEGHMNLKAPPVWRTWNSSFFTAIWRSWKSGFVLALRKHVKKTETTLIHE